MSKPKNSKTMKHIEVLISFLWLIPLVSYIPSLFTLWFDQPLLINLFSLLIIVPLLSYLLMPLSLHLLNKNK